METFSALLAIWIHRSSVNSPHKGQWRGALMFSLMCTRIHGWVNNGESGDLRRHRAHDDVTVMNLCFMQTVAAFKRYRSHIKMDSSGVILQLCTEGTSGRGKACVIRFVKWYLRREHLSLPTWGYKAKLCGTPHYKCPDKHISVSFRV